MVYIQASNGDNSPGLATDENGPYVARSYHYVSKSWEKTNAEQGNYMIRARVAYEVEGPAITTPVNGLFTNNASISR